MLKRLRIKFICINMTIVTVMLGIIFGTVIHFTHSNLETQSIQLMQRVLTEPIPPSRPGDPSPDMPLPYFVLLQGRDGKIITLYNNYYDLSDEIFLTTLVDIVSAAEEPMGVISRYDLRFCKTTSPWGERVVFADMSTENSIIAGLLRSCALIAAGSFLVFLFISILLARWCIRPVELAWQRQRQFVADASHELKTPLTVITTNAELLQSDGGDPAAREKYSDSILSMSRQMRGLVDGLLELARLDTGAVRTTLTPVDLSQLLQDAVLPFDALFFEAGLELSCDIAPDMRVKGSEDHLRQVVDILLDNARKYSSPDGVVTLALSPGHRGHCLLRVSNPGPAISKEDQTRIFERFYRVDKVRSMNHSYGLGLSIARRIVTDHGGRIWCESEDGINTFFVQLSTI